MFIKDYSNVLIKNMPAMQETQVWSLGLEDPLENKMATHFSILAWKIPMHRGAWRATVHGVAKSWTRLSDFLVSLPRKTVRTSGPCTWRAPWASPSICTKHSLINRTRPYSKKKKKTLKWYCLNKNFKCQ